MRRDISFTCSSDGESFDYDLGEQSNGQKMWLCVRNVEPPPCLVSHRISFTIVAAREQRGPSGGASLRPAADVLAELDRLIDEPVPLWLDGWDGRRYRVLIERQQSAIIEPFSAERLRENEYYIGVNCVALYTEESCL